MPMQWLNVLAHHTTKDKASLLQKLKYEMTVADVYDLLEYHSYEDYRSYEQYRKDKQNNNRN